MSDKMTDKIKGVAKEAVGKAMGDDDTQKEGESQQAEAQKRPEAERAEEEAAEKRQQAAGHKGEEARRQD